MQSQRQRPLTQEEWDEWKESPVTSELFNYFGREAAGNRDIAALGGCKIIDDKIVDFQRTGVSYIYRMILAEIFEGLHELRLEDILTDEN